tara:strand:- start:377 stop:610 length:234 start_codon:yes stop_codon:yes gene_type:complete
MKKTVNRKLSVKELEKRTDILMQQLVILQEMVDMVGDNFIKYVRFKDDEKGFMDFIKVQKESKPKSAKTATKRKASS